ncbi:MAG: hypothetical protein CME64_08530 [Halobacteriovoraceae bacterium]|nr:hypothetical protein [Halobacteriovoraceae bacterium]|tara:strand:+ start:798 stop:1394 length:597 start_codon:yes stop_codon:yes gene_type:complete
MSSEIKQLSKKEEIISASIEIFVNEGFDRPTMDSIASRAKVSKRTLYKYFSNKHALLDEIIFRLVDEKHSSLNFKYSKDEDILLQIQNIIKHKTDHLLCPSNLKLAKIILSEALKGEGFLKDMLEEVLRTERVTLEWIKQAQEDQKLLKEEPLVILDFLNELVNGIIFFPILFGKKDQVTKKEIEDVSRMFLFLKGVN